MIEREAILTEFGRMAGLTGEEAKEWENLCDSCGRALEKRLRAGADPADPALPAAAAAMAYYRWLLQQGGKGKIQVGPVHLDEGDLLARGKRLEEEYLALCSGLLLPACSMLRGTEG